MANVIEINHSVIQKNVEYFDSQSSALERAHNTFEIAKSSLMTACEGEAVKSYCRLADELIGNLKAVSLNVGTFSKKLFQADSSMSEADHEQSITFGGADH